MKLKTILFSITALTSGLAQAEPIIPIRAPIHDFPTIPPILLVPREVPCTDMLKPYFDWASRATPAPEDRRGIQMTSVFNQNRNTSKTLADSKVNLVGYSNGELTYKSGVLVGDVRSSFSDRMFCANPSSGFCVSMAPFNPNATDIAGITLTQDGKLTTVLKSWGNATSTDTLVCMSNGVIYAAPKAGERSMMVITLQKTGFVSPH